MFTWKKPFSNLWHVPAGGVGIVGLRFLLIFFTMVSSSISIHKLFQQHDTSPLLWSISIHFEVELFSPLWAGASKFPQLSYLGGVLQSSDQATLTILRSWIVGLMRFHRLHVFSRYLGVQFLLVILGLVLLLTGLIPHVLSQAFIEAEKWSRKHFNCSPWSFLKQPLK